MDLLRGCVSTPVTSLDSYHTLWVATYSHLTTEEGWDREGDLPRGKHGQQRGPRCSSRPHWALQRESSQDPRATNLHREDSVLPTQGTGTSSALGVSMKRLGETRRFSEERRRILPFVTSIQFGPDFKQSLWALPNSGYTNDCPLLKSRKWLEKPSTALRGGQGGRGFWLPGSAGDSAFHADSEREPLICEVGTAAFFAPATSLL